MKNIYDYRAFDCLCYPFFAKLCIQKENVEGEVAHIFTRYESYRTMPPKFSSAKPTSNSSDLQQSPTWNRFAREKDRQNHREPS